MTHLIKLATGKLNDPILMDWALDRYRQASEGRSPRQQAMEQAWFDELTLRRWLNSDDHETLNRLFVHLPEERFSNLGQAIAERWNDWGGNLAYHSAPILARYQPELAWRCFAEPPGGRHLDVESILGIIRSLKVLPPDEGLVLLKAIATQVIASTEDGFSRELKLSELVSASLAFDRVVALEVIKAQLKAITSIREWDRLLDQVARGLFGHSVYGQLASDIRKGHSNQSFQQLAAFFREDAPLGLLDELSRKDSGLDELMGLLDRLLDEKDHIIVQLIRETMSSKRLAEHRERLDAFLIGIVASACEHTVLDASQMPLHETVTLLAADLAEPRHFEALLARLRMFDQREVMPALVGSLERERTTYGGLAVARAMGELGWEGFTTPLTASMGEECGDFLHEAANDALIRIGEPARDHLILNWDSLDRSQRIYGLSVIEAVSGAPAAVFAVDRYVELFHDDPENWCQLALSTPERRLLELLEQHLPRQQRLFDETFYQLARLLDVAHPDLASIAERVQNARADVQAHRAALQRGDWFNQTLRLELKCPVCGDSNEYEVQRVAINPGSKETDLLLAHEFPCASCGQWVDFEFTPGAHMALTAELLKLAADSDAGLTGESKVLIQAEVPYNGQSLPVGEVVSRCKAALANHPDSIADWLRLGYCYHQLLSRPRQGLEYAERALAVEPNAVEAVFQKAEAMAMQGDEAAAFQLLDQALESKAHWRFFLTDVAKPAQLTTQFAHVYNELVRSLGRTDRASLHSTFLGVSKKVGRNDPCPCGSGKKYKKCCLAKHGS
jgi:tetratricopeptide (TPR) repeat protein